MRTAILSLFSAVAFVSLPAAAEPTRATNSDEPAVKAALDRQAANIDLSHADQLSVPASNVPSAPGVGMSAPHGDGVRSITDTNARASRAAGATRGVALSASGGGERPLAGVRVQQRMDSHQVIASLEPTLRACAQRSHISMAPATTVTVRLSVNPNGEVEGVKVVDRAGARDEVLACVVDVASNARFRAPSGAGAALIVPVILPAKTPSLAVAVSPAAATPPASAPAAIAVAP